MAEAAPERVASLAFVVAFLGLFAYLLYARPTRPEERWRPAEERGQQQAWA